ncbi:LytTR family DNA-binding domain-containing protein [Hanstruepera marina]|uniref:LytTR family DNA-binding domain-containing protein n=1 Tax=Hanstruepera marina TaxID=2873265 RepID=UPI001CA7A676|nr:LytTR family DNA-binding domain-containing protein [Hanstruepera marina]
MFKNKSIAYTSSWLNTFLLSSILGTVIVFILIFLKPFDSDNESVNYHNLKLFGYGFSIVLPILILHFFEEFWFNQNNKKWFLYQEVIVLSIGFFFIALTSYFYNTYIVNDLNVDSNYILSWVKEFGAPFAPIFMPLWIYLRFRFSKVVISPIQIKKEATISLKGNNQNEELHFFEKDFVLAKAQANYVDVYFLKNNQLNKKMIRHSISGITELIPSSQQIHRSHLVNPSMIISIHGNTRKGNVILKHIEEKVPISPKHFLGVKKYLQTRP